MLHGANHLLVPSSNYQVPVLIREGFELGQGIGNKTLDSRWPPEVSSCSIFQQQKPTGIMSAYEVNFSNKNVTKQVSKD